MRKRWSEYFEGLLNVFDDRVADVECIGRGGVQSERVRESGLVEREEVVKALRKMKCGKAAGLDGIAVEFIKKGGDCVVDWLVRIFNVCMGRGEVPEDWRNACIVPLYKGKGDKGECSNYRGISLLSIPGKLYGRVLIERVKACTEHQIGEEQCGFRSGRGCVDQVFALKNVCEKYLDKQRDLYVAFMDLEKAYDRVDREALWKVLRIYGVGGKLLEAVRSFYQGCKACVRVGNEESDWFPVKVGLRQGCVMSPWLFNLFMDGVVREVNARVLERGASMQSVGDERAWEVSQLLFADDTALVADSSEKLQKLVTEFGKVCERRKLRVNVNKSKAIRFSRVEGQVDWGVSLNGKKLEEVQCFRYLGVDLAANGSMEAEVSHRVGEGARVLGAMKNVWKERTISWRAKMGMFEGIVVPTILYGCEAWAIDRVVRRRVDVLEMKCLRNICGVRWFDRVSNVRVREMCGNKKSVVERAEEGVLKWFGHMERMSEERLTKKIYVSEVEGTRRRGRPNWRWKDGVKGILSGRGLSMQEGERSARNRVKWNDVVYRGRRAVNGLNQGM